MKNLFNILILSIAFFSCATQKNAENFYNKHPEKLAEKCIDEFPIESKTDSTAYKQSLSVIDSLINAATNDKMISDAERNDLIEEIDRIKNSPEPNCDSLSDAIYRLAAKEKLRADKLQLSNKELQQAAKNIKPIRDTVEDTRKIFLLESQVEDMSAANEKQALQIDELREFKRSMAGKVHIPWLWIVIAGIALAGWGYFRIKAGALNKIISKLK